MLRSVESVLSSAILMVAVWMLVPTPAQAQVTYNGTQKTIISGILNGGQTPYGLAVDSSGNVWVSGQGQPTSYILEYSKSNGYQFNGVSLDTDFGGTAYGSSAFSIAFDSTGLMYIPAPQDQYVVTYRAGDSFLGAVDFGNFSIGVGYGLDGNLYVADNIDDNIYELSLTGGNSGVIITPGYCSPYSVTADSAGNVYIPCVSEVLKYTNEGGGSYSQSVVTSSLSDSGYFQLGITVDRNGIVYICDSHNNRVLREVPNASGGYSESVLPWSYNNPSGITLDNQGNLYVSDSYNGNIDEISFPTPNFGSLALGTASATQTFSFNIASGATIGKIASLTNGQPTQDFPYTTTCTTGAHSSSGNCSLTVSFSPTAVGARNGAFVFYDQNGNILYSFAMSGIGQAPQLVFNGALTATSLSEPAYTSSGAMALDQAGNLFVANQASIIYPEYPLYPGSILEYPLSNGTYGAPVTIATMNNPVGVTVTANGSLFVVCDNPTENYSWQYLIYEVPKNQSGFGAPVLIASSQSSQVLNVVSDGQSNVFFLAYSIGGNGVIYEFPFTGYTYLPPVEVASGFQTSGGMTIDSAGNLYVANISNAILNFTASSGYKTSTTVASGLASPLDLAIEPGGNMLVVNQVELSTSGNLQLLPASASGFGEPITLVPSINEPNGLAVDRSGNIFVASGTSNQPNSTLLYRRLSPALSFANTTQGSTSTDSPKSVTLENFGNLPLDFSEISFPSDFPESSSESSDCSSSTALAGGGICTLTFNFSPDAAIPAGKTSLKLSETASVTTNSLNTANTVASVALSGTETLPAAALALSASPSPVYGAPVTLTATVTGGEGLATAAPSGTVTFYLGPSSLGTATLTAGAGATSSASISTSKLAAGMDGLTFTYSGDTSYSAATSPAMVINVAQATPTATLAISPAAISPSEQATLKATVVTGITGVTATGTVTFTYYGASAPSGVVLNTATLNTVGMASITQLLPSGEGLVTATYSGNSNLTAATSSYVGVDVVALPTSLAVTSSSGQVGVGTAVKLNAVLSGLVKGYTTTGGFTFYANSVAIGSATVSTVGTASITTSSLPVGTNSITATYSGDSNYASENSYPIEVTTIPDTPKFTLSASPATPGFGAPVSVTATIATTDGTTSATGSVNFIVDDNTVGGGNLSGGSITTAVGVLLPGVHHYQAIYSGDSNYAAATSPLASLSVAKATPAVVLSASTSSPTVAAPALLTAHVTSALTPPTGTVTFYYGSTSLGTVSLVSGAASVTASLPAGAYTVTVKYNGDANFATTSSAAEALTVAQSQPVATPTASPTSIVLGNTVLLKLTLGNISSTHPPTGTVEMSKGGALIASGNISGGSASFTVLLPEGSNEITASYSGDSNYRSATSRLNVNVAPATSSTALTINPTSSAFGGNVTLSATVTSSYTSATPTGSVQFFYGTVLIGTETLSGNTAVLTTNALPGGTDYLSAHYLGDGNFQASASSSKSIVVAKNTPALALGSSATVSTEGTQVTLTASLTGVSTGTGVTYPTGTVKFSLGNTTLGAVSPVNGQATLQLSTLPVGTDSILASYGGDTNFEHVESTAVVVAVSKGASSVTLTPSASSTQVGQAFTLTAVVSGSGITPTGKVTFYDGSTLLGSATLTSGSASITPSLPAGSDSLTATYAGDSNYTGSSATAITESVSSGAPQISLSASPSTASAGTQVTFTVDVSIYGTTLLAGGNVSISCNGPFITNSPVTVTNGVATFSTSTLPSGYYPCEALYSGDSNFRGGNSNVIWISIN